MSDELKKDIQDLHDDIHNMPSIPTHQIQTKKDWKFINDVTFDLNQVFTIYARKMINNRQYAVVAVTQYGAEVLLYASDVYTGPESAKTVFKQTEDERKRILEILGFVGE